VGTVEVLEEGVWYDGDGDVVMRDVPLGCAWDRDVVERV